MKSLIVIAIAVNLVIVKGSRIIQQDLDYEHLLDNGLDDISVDGSNSINAGRNLAELQNMGTLTDYHIDKRGNNFKCEGSTCKACYVGLCLGVTHLPENDKLLLHVKFHEHTLFDKEIEAKPYTRCQKTKFFGVPFTPCLKLTDMSIQNSKVCTRVTVSVSPVPKDFKHDLCV